MTITVVATVVTVGLLLKLSLLLLMIVLHGFEDDKMMPIGAVGILATRLVLNCLSQKTKNEVPIASKEIQPSKVI